MNQTSPDPRGPLYLTSSEAKNWFSLNSQDIGREVIIREWRPAEIPADQPWPPRVALGWNAQGVWEWLS